MHKTVTFTYKGYASIHPLGKTKRMSEGRVEYLKRVFVNKCNIKTGDGIEDILNNMTLHIEEKNS